MKICLQYISTHVLLHVNTRKNKIHTYDRQNDTTQHKIARTNSSKCILNINDGPHKFVLKRPLNSACPN